MRGALKTFLFSGLFACMTSLGTAWAADKKPEPARDWMDSGRLLATSGVSQVEGAAGGGLASWAVISGYGTRDSVGGNLHGTYIGLPDFTLRSGGLSLGLFNRLELSYTRQAFDTNETGPKLGLPSNYVFSQHIFGAKLRLIGDLVYDQDSFLPQLSAGLQYKKNDRGNLVRALGAKSDHGTDFYLSATKLFLAQSLLVNATARATKANQFGLLGFGGDKKSSYSTEFEGSLAYLLRRDLAIGVEYRTKPDNLSFAHEDDAWDIFAAWFINKNLSATVAYVDLGDIALQTKQRGLYLSLQTGF
tara:strand:+ start:355988 stop:356896 length:909 start_codon:yes stop_codon:yes gene_type:complete